MINIIIISYIVASIAYIALLVNLTSFWHKEIIEEKIGEWGNIALGIIFLPAVLLTVFYIWNFMDCKTNQEIAANQHISKTETTENKNINQ